MEKIPNEIIYNILHNLETDYVLVLSIVNKNFNSITKDFINKEIMIKEDHYKNINNFINIYEKLKLSNNITIYKTDHFINKYKIKILKNKICNVMYMDQLFFVHYHRLNKGYNYDKINDFYKDFLYEILLKI